MNVLKIVYDTKFMYPAQIVEKDWRPSPMESNGKWKDLKHTVGKPMQDLNSALRLLNMDLDIVSDKQLDFARASRIKVIENIFDAGLWNTLNIRDNDQYFKLAIYYELSGCNMFDREDVVYVTVDDFNYYLGVWYIFDKMYELGLNGIKMKLSEDANTMYGIYSPQLWIECSSYYESYERLLYFVRDALLHYLNMNVVAMRIPSFIRRDSVDVNSIKLSDENTDIYYARCLKELRNSKSFCKQITNISKLGYFDIFDMFTDVEYEMEQVRQFIKLNPKSNTSSVTKPIGGKKKYIVNLV